jgi:hypothetical protein
MTENQGRSPGRSAGLTLIVGSVLSVAAMTHHPSTAASGTAERLSEMTHEATLAGIVHGVLIALMLLVLWGLLRLAGILGWSSSRVQIGAIAYGAGVICMVGAATVSGFVVPGLAEHFVEAAPEIMESSLPVFRLCFEINQALAQIGAIAMSVGIFLWSWVLAAGAGYRRWVRGLGGLGLVVGTLPVLGLLSGSLHLDVHGMLAVLLAQAGWTICIGAWMLRLAREQAER